MVSVLYKYLEVIRVLTRNGESIINEEWSHHKSSSISNGKKNTGRIKWTSVLNYSSY